MFLYTLDETLTRIRDLLSLLPSDRVYYAGCIMDWHLPAIQNVVESKGFHKFFETTSYLYIFPKEKAAHLTIPQLATGFTLAPLTEAHIDEIDSQYPHRNSKTPYLFKKLMKFNVSLGLFDAEGKLVCWCFRYQSGVLNALQTVEGVRQRGYGSIVAIAMMRELAKRGEDATACVILSNSTSQRLFEKLGFEALENKIHWYGYAAPGLEL